LGAAFFIHKLWQARLPPVRERDSIGTLAEKHLEHSTPIQSLRLRLRHHERLTPP
jgi:hypothetical protein